jgi:hypothetical protein
VAKPDVWLIGDWQRGEFAAARKWLVERGQCRRFAHIKAAATQRGNQAPAMVVVAQTRPRQMKTAEWQQLTTALSAAKLVLLTGPWCEGEHRPQPQPPEVIRVPWKRWRPGLEAAMEESNVAVPEGLSERKAAAAIWSPCRAAFEPLADALSRLNVEAAWLGGSDVFTAPADLVVYDGWQNVLPLPRTRSSNLPPRILILNFPRPDDTLAADALGIDAILPRPLVLSDLALTLDRLLNRR